MAALFSWKAGDSGCSAPGGSTLLLSALTAMPRPQHPGKLAGVQALRQCNTARRRTSGPNGPMIV